MKLSHIPGLEPTTKLQHSYKNSTVALLNRYVEFYREQTGHDVHLKDVTEQMLLQFMNDDKAFLKFVKDGTAPKPSAKAKTPTAPASPQVPSQDGGTAHTPGVSLARSSD